MSKSTFNSNIDRKIMERREDGIHICLRGWCLPEGGADWEPEFRLDGKACPEFTANKEFREDIVRVFKVDGKFGFLFRTVLKEDLFQEKLELGALCGSEFFPVYSMTKEELLNELNGNRIYYSVDYRRFDNEQLILRGWALVQNHEELTFRLFDEDGREITDLKKRSVVRSDVSREFFDSTDYADCGFEVTTRDFKGKKGRLEISCEAAAESYPFTRKALEKETKKSKQKYIGLKEAVKRTKPGDVVTDVKTLFTGGPEELKRKWNDRYVSDGAHYDLWLERHTPGKKELAEQRAVKFSYAPMVSILVPAYHTPKMFLKQMIESVQAQTYSNWELCIADGGTDDKTVETIVRAYHKKDKRVRYRRLDDNKGISGNTNAALAMAKGEFTALLDHDDILTPDALYEMIRAVNEDPEIDVLYSDEDKISMNLKRVFEPYFKPDFNPDLLCSNNYICHFFMVRTEIAKAVHGFDHHFDGSQDHDFIFRTTEKARKVCHIPKILYHWRMHMGSMAANTGSKEYCYEAGRKAVEAHLKRTGISARVLHHEDVKGCYRVRYEVQGDPMVSVLIPNKDHIDDLKKCIDSILAKTSWKNYEIIVIENNSTEPETFAYYEEIEKHPKVQVVYWKSIFNYSALNNFGAGFAKGEYLMLLNNDTEIINDIWMEQMVGSCQRENAAVIGAKLLYPDDTIQHCGVVIGAGGVAGHVYSGQPRDYTGDFAKAQLQQNLNCVTAACMLVKRSVYDELGGFNEDLKVAFNDVDFCLRVRKAGYDIIYEPDALLYHYESKSRGFDRDEAGQKRFQSEVEYMLDHWGETIAQGDSFFTPNLRVVNGIIELA